MDFLPAETPHLQAAYTGGPHLGTIQEGNHRTSRTRQGSSPLSSNGISESSQDTLCPPSKRPRINYECDACGTTYTEKRALARHRHTDMHRRRLGLQPDKRHLCVKCGRSFGRNHDLQRHRREQHGEATGATTIDVSSCPSDGSALSSDDTLYGEHLRAVKSSANFRHQTTSSTSSQSKSSKHGSRPPIKTESDASVNDRTWPKEASSIASQRIFTPPSKQEPQPSRRHSSVSLPREGSDISSAKTASPAPQASTSGTPSSQSSRDDAQRPRPSARVMASQACAQPRNLEALQPVVCMVCGSAFEEDDALIDHLQTHLEGFKGKHRCDKCQIGFDHEEDLQSHLDSARKGHCGFSFVHSEPCKGHHPPDGADGFGKMPDSDCFRLENRLRHWEQAQLRAYIADINDLIASRDKQSHSRWSVEALLRSHRHSSTSFRSVAISVNSYASAPCDGTNGKLDVEGLQKRMKSMSLKDVRAKLMGKASIGYTSKPSGPFDKPLQTAIQRHNLKKANELLYSGADPLSLINASGTLTAAALWDSSEVQQLTVAHRLTEDIQGSCDICKMNSATFPRGSNKIKALLAHGADASQKGGLCGTPINTAAWLCKADIVFLLLQHRAYVNQRDLTFGTPLGVAANHAGFPGSNEVVEKLLSYGANIEIEGKEGKPLAIAKRRLRFWEDSPQVMQISADVLDERIKIAGEVVRLLEEAHNGRQFE